MRYEAWRCDWCEALNEYQGDDADIQAASDGWFRIVTDDGEHTFCCSDCLVASL